ncbi:hypothetical protein TNCV_687691 [Trichonephila clavipes]|nr:hypothetical protein TNCV_687691 [Trichonephila clavipes]
MEVEMNVVSRDIILFCDPNLSSPLLLEKAFERGSAKDDPELPRVPITNICHYGFEEIELQLRLKSDPPSLQAPESWYPG